MCLEKVANVIIEEKILEPNSLDLTIVLIATFACCAIYNNVFTFKSKDYSTIEIVPTVLLGFAIVVIMISRALVYISSSRKLFEKSKDFNTVLEKINLMIAGFNKDLFSNKGYTMSINKHCGYIKLEHFQPSK